VAVAGVDFEVRGGEILGVAGVDGNGQTELAEALAGTRFVEGGRVFLDGEDVTRLGANARQERGLAYVPEDRGTKGLVQDFALYENNVLKTYDEPPFSRYGWIFPNVMRRRAAEALSAYDVRPADPDARAGSLSGGNQQKAVLARELSGDPGVIIAAQPTRGVDVGAIEFIHGQLLQQRSEGKAILLISLELEEVRSLSDRILVMYAGRIVGEVGPEATDEQLGLLMAGRGVVEKSA
jgi:simple sugar transport system ATP-binding protein